ncbi:molybdopterin-dependent oxidoreductase [Paralcaligenes ureilyticus]|uniref:Sulfite dehydrogenase (Cytochrome) subunit SorA apoprotein n=1 Tax=Paralcaligenes ureilyticus TaxID=627131 RepID=A0A4R3LKM6_9BURK|nr:molybdopterin-dependent oxidoreductase [Paralcaligenes ureilyticus]TCT00441.1 sulfite dehydrogenase (cytochrome) subunit SorA apoprotein [Paralcaligenes ureilyticus]
MLKHNQEARPGARRKFLQMAGTMGAGAALGGASLNVFAAAAKTAPDTTNLPFANGLRQMATFPQKRSLILLTSRPPQLETPFAVYNDGIFTPNDAFFVRYHWSGIPTNIDPATYRVAIKGVVDTPLSLSLEDIKQMGAVKLAAAHQCSGNSRGFSNPRVPGGESANGAMGNAIWTGVPLKKVLEKAGVKAGAVQVTFNGLDHPPVGDGPDFIKALDLNHAMDGEVMLAWAMNGTDLPMLNGYPLRLVVPGYYGTYWVKHLSDIEVVDKPLANFWMATAYRVPDNECACVAPGGKMEKSRPIGRFSIRSFITSVLDGGKIPAGKSTVLRGIAFDGGYGVTNVDVSADGGKTWHQAKLGTDHGKYSFREWTMPFKPAKRGALELKVRATNRIGQTQPMSALWNPSGYMRNVVETTRVTAV